MDTTSLTPQQLAVINQWISWVYPQLFRQQALSFDPGDYLLQHGQFYTSVLEGKPKKKKKACFRNAALGVIYQENEHVEYVEGIVTAPIVGPILHAWNLVDGQAVDYTLTPTEGDVYFGVVLPISVVIEAQTKPLFRPPFSDMGVLATLAAGAGPQLLEELGIKASK